MKPDEASLTSAIYEREFKGILGGEDKVLQSVLKTCSLEDRLAYESARSRPFLVVRAAGSLGADLVAVRHDVSFLVEVKSSKEDTLYFTAAVRLVEQSQEIRAQCERSGVLPIYALRLKGVRGDAWRLFTMPEMRLDGRAGSLHKRLPPVERTEKGNEVLRWKNGLPLARFLDYLCGDHGNGVAARGPEASVEVSPS